MQLPSFCHSHRGIVRFHSSLVPVIAAMLTAAAPSARAYDWLQFNGDPQHSGNNTLETTLSAANVSSLASRYQVTPSSSASDGSIVFLDAVNTSAGFQDLLFFNTQDEHILALNAHTGAQVWAASFPSTGAASQCSAGQCITNSTPVIDPNRRYIYTIGYDGYLHKLLVGSGAEVKTGGWPQLSTLKPDVEKQSSALALATVAGTSYLYAATSAHNGDGGDYQGHLTTVNLSNGHQTIFNMVCSDRAIHFVEASGSPDCSSRLSGAWARPGAVYDAGTGRLFVGSGNGPFAAASHNWGDSILALTPSGVGNAGVPLDAYTPTNQQTLDNNDTDLGSTAPAILPVPANSNVQHLAVQSGKDGQLRLLNLANLSGQGGPGNLGGEVGAIINVPQGGAVRTQPAVWVNPADHSTWVFVVNSSGASGLQLVVDSGGNPSLTTKWNIHTSGASPLVANNVLFFAGSNNLVALNPTTGAPLWNSTSIGSIHWQSPVVACSSLYIADSAGKLSAFGLALNRPSVYAGSDQSAPVGQSFAQALSVSVTNAQNAPQASVAVTFQLPASGASGTFAGGGKSAMATTGANGIATSPAIVSNGTVGNYVASATIGGGACAANFHLANVTSIAGETPYASVLAKPDAFTGAWPGFSFGLSGDIPMVMNLGGSTIPLVYRPNTTHWFFDLAGFANYSPGTTQTVQFGLPGDSPQILRVQGADHIAVYRPSNDLVFLDLNNQTAGASNVQIIGPWTPLIPATVMQVVANPGQFDGTWYDFSFGLPGDTPLLIQLTAGGPKLPAVFRPAGGNWFINLGGFADYDPAKLRVVQFGLNGDIPQIVYWNGGDHLAVYRPSTHQLLIDTNNQSYDGTNVLAQ